MKIICEKDELVKGSQITQTVVPPRSTLPILSNFLLEAENNQLKLSSTDLEVGVTCFIKGEVVKEGAITMPAKRFGDIIRELPEGQPIEIKSDDTNQVSIRCGKSHFSLMGLSKVDYPVLPTFPAENFTLSREMLKTMFRKAAFAVSTDETRYVLNGVYMMIEKGTIKLVSTDGRRLAYISREAADKTIQRTAIIPTKAVNELQRILNTDEKGDDVKVGITENQIAFNVGSITIISRLIEGSFPNYEQVIPKKHDVQVKLKVKETMQAVRQMSTLSLDKASAIRFTFGKNTLRISASAQGLGSGEAELDIEYSGPLLEIAFNPIFLIDILKNADDDTVAMELTGSLNPALVHPMKDPQYQCVVMPMRL